TIAKLAYHVMKKGYTCVVAAADTFRAGAIEQLEKHAEAVGFKLIKHSAGADPAAVAFDAVEHARARGRDVVLIDTAGRMQTIGKPVVFVNLGQTYKDIRRFETKWMVDRLLAEA